MTFSQMKVRRKMLLAFANNKWVNAETLAAQLDCCVRTVYRDVAALVRAGHNVVSTQRKGIRYYPREFC